MAAASTQRLARVIGVVGPPVPWLPVVGIARLGGYLRLSVAADLADVRIARVAGVLSQLIPAQARVLGQGWDSPGHVLDTFPTRQPRGSPGPSHRHIPCSEALPWPMTR